MSLVMSDPIRNLLGWLEPRGRMRIAKSDTELIEHRDRVEFAVSLIRNHELGLWFERDWPIAELIAARCPECIVMSIPTGAIWIDEMDKPTPWHTLRHNNGIV